MVADRRRDSLASGLPHHLAADHRHHRPDEADVVLRHGQIITVEHDEVGEEAGVSWPRQPSSNVNQALLRV